MTTTVANLPSPPIRVWSRAVWPPCRHVRRWRGRTFIYFKAR